MLRILYWVVTIPYALIGETSKGCLALIYGNCALDDLKDAPPWPTGDIIYHEFQ
jgi:hypothetical protein